MLQPDPGLLRHLVEQYEALALLNEEQEGDTGLRQRLEDVSYTLCVSTGTKDVIGALTAARRRLPDHPVDGTATPRPRTRPAPA